MLKLLELEVEVLVVTRLTLITPVPSMKICRIESIVKDYFSQMKEANK